MTLNKEGLEAALLPCPFCGDRAFRSVTLDNGHYVMCRSEACWAMTGYLPTEAEAIAAWNRRAAPALPDHIADAGNMVPAPDGLVERLLRQLTRTEEGAGTMPAKQAVKLHPDDWNGLCRLVREAATALQSKDEQIERLTRERDEALENGKATRGLLEYAEDSIARLERKWQFQLERADDLEQQVRDMRAGLQFYADPKTYQEPTRERWAADNPGKDPTVAIRCGRFSVEAKSGHVVAPIYLDDAGRRARLLLKEGGE